jgi:hypothetical protein
MRYFLDTEFNEGGHTVPLELISIGLVSEGGGEFYAISTEFEIEHCNEFVRTNVLPKLPSQTHSPQLHGNRHKIRSGIMDFVGNDPKPEFWAYYADYDWVLFAQLFGTMVNLPPRFPQYCLDVKQYQHMLGVRELPEQDPADEHIAVADARWTREAWTYLRSIERAPVQQAKPSQKETLDAIARGYVDGVEDLTEKLMRVLDRSDPESRVVHNFDGEFTATWAPAMAFELALWSERLINPREPVEVTGR